MKPTNLLPQCFIRVVSVPLFLALAVVGPARAADFVILLDCSGSMREGVKHMSGQMRITVVEKSARNYIQSLPSGSRLKLIAFNDTIREDEIVLRSDEDRQRAIRWVESLEAETRKNRGTALWTAVRRALRVATGYAHQNPGQLITVRVLSDGLDTETRQTPAQALPALQKDFPLVDGESIKANLLLLGSFDMSVFSHVTWPGFEVGTNPELKDLFPPVIAWSPDPVEAGKLVAFYDNSNGTFDAYEWSVNDAAVGTGKSLVIKFNRGETKKITLTGISNGRRLSATASVTARDSELSADFVISTSEIEPNKPVDFFGRATGQPVTWEWFIDGNAFAKGQDCATKFPTAGEYTVKLVVADATGHSAEAVKRVLVREQMVKVDFTFAPEPATNGEPVRFISDVSVPTTNFFWAFGDGVTSRERHPVHVYTSVTNSPEEFEAVLTVTQESGRSFSARKRVHVLPERLEADFKTPAAPVVSGQTVQLASDVVGRVARIEWRGDDGWTSTERNPARRFVLGDDKEREFEITLRAISASGRSATVSKRVRVVPEVKVPPPVARIRVNGGNTHKAGATVELLDDSKGLIESYEWNFNNEATSTAKNPTVRFDKPGTKRIRLIVRGPGGSSTNEVSVTISPRFTAPAIEKITATAIKGTVPLKSDFLAWVSGDYIEAEWTFGDGSRANGTNATHTFGAEGSFQATLTLKPADPAHEPAKAALLITVQPPAPWWIGPGIGVAFVSIASGLLLWRRRLRPLYGTLRWEYHGQTGALPLTGAEFNLKQLGIPGWTPSQDYTVRNRGAIRVYGPDSYREPISSPQDAPLNIDGVSLVLDTDN